MQKNGKLVSMMAGLVLVLSCSSCLTLKPEREQVLAEYNLEAFRSKGGETPMSVQWWEVFGSAQLNELMGQAFAGSLTLEQAMARLDQAAALARKSGADAFVHLNAQGESASRYERGGEDDSTTFVRSVGLYASYEVDLWGRVRSARNAADATWKASAFDVQTAAMSLSAELATTYFNWLTENERLRIYESQLVANQNKLQALELRFETGQATALDVLQQRQLVAGAEAKLPPVRRAIQVDENRIAILIGRVPGQVVELAVEPLPALPAKPATGLPLELLENRPDIQSARLSLEAADWNIGAARAARLPTLSLTGSVRSDSEHFDELFDSWISNLAAGLLAPLLDGGSRRGEVDRTMAVAREAIASYRLTVLTAVEETENALVTEQEQLAYVAALGRQYAAAQNSERESIRRYQFGILPYLDAVTAIVSRQNLEVSQLQARTDLLNNRIQLYRALGGDWTFILEKKS